MKRVALAKVRTILSNHRTFLAYLRTAFAFVIGGLAVIHFFDHAYAFYFYLGLLFIICGALVFTIGITRTRKSFQDIKSIYSNPDDPP